MKSAIYNKRGSAYIDTSVIIIICVVVGSLLLAGIVALFTGIILPKLNSEVQDMIHIDETPISYRFATYENKVSTLQYSYDGTTWLPSNTPRFSEDATVVKSLVELNDNNVSFAIVKENTHYYIIRTEDNGANWMTVRDMGNRTSVDDRYTYRLTQNRDASGITKYYAEVRTYRYSTGTQGIGVVYVSTDGIKWTVDAYKDYF